jgi:uncharacterized Fe-S cluster protein YjdI
MKSKREITMRYSNGEISVVWKPKLCIHAGACFLGLPEVFDPNRKPWIDPMAATTDELKKQVAKCPSGALSIGPPRSPEAGKGLI